MNPCVEISVWGCSTIFVAETFMPFLSSPTVAGLPSTMNLKEGRNRVYRGFRRYRASESRSCPRRTRPSRCSEDAVRTVTGWVVVRIVAVNMVPGLRSPICFGCPSIMNCCPGLRLK